LGWKSWKTSTIFRYSRISFFIM